MCKLCPWRVAASLAAQRQTRPPGGAQAAHGWSLALQLPGTGLAGKALPDPQGSPEVAATFLPDSQVSLMNLAELSADELV